MGSRDWRISIVDWRLVEFCSYASSTVKLEFVFFAFDCGDFFAFALGFDLGVFELDEVPALPRLSASFSILARLPMTNVIS